MAKVGAQRAAELTGRSKSTVQRAMNTGKLSFDVDAHGRRVVDVSELERVFGLEKPSNNNAAMHEPSVEHELEKATNMLEIERLKMQIKMLEEQLDAAQQQIDDIKTQRDLWQRQASQVLITSQYSQKQAEDLREEMKDRERRAREKQQQMVEMKRKQQLEEKMQKIKADNENQSDAASAEADQGRFKGLWKRMKKSA